MSSSTPLVRVAGTNTYEAATTASSCHGLAAAVVARDGSPTAAALAAAHDTLSERRPVVADVLDFGALTGARSGTASDPLTMKERER
jgi:hypothetical protein